MDFIRRSRVEIASQEKSWCGENRKKKRTTRAVENKSYLIGVSLDTR